MHIQNEKGINCKILFIDYDKLLNTINCNNIDKKMTSFCLKRAVKNIKNKLNIQINQMFKKLPVQLVLAGSILTTSITIPSIISLNNPSIQNVSIKKDTAIDKNITKETTINENNLYKYDNIIENDNTNDIEILVIDENEIVNNLEANEKINNNTIDYSELANFKSLDEYIVFASKLYNVDIEVANQLLKDKINNMDNYINNSNNRELKNLYELKKLGVINGDLNIMGIFVIIKGYANEMLEINNEEPIISQKTATEKEKDLINIAQYIYGIDNTDMLNTMIAIHRLETGHGTSSYALKLNNLGGNMNSSPTQKDIDRFIRIIGIENNNIENIPIPNIYKTIEIGEESMVRNYLNIYTKCLHDENCMSENNIVDFLSRKYCTHTPDAWSKTIHEMLSTGTIQNDVNNYINNHNKTM